MEPAQRFAYLFGRYQSQTLTLKERMELMALIRNDQYEVEVLSFIDSYIQLDFSAETLRHQPDPAIARLIFSKVQQHISTGDPVPETRSRIRFLPSRWLRYAAMLLLLLGAGMYFLVLDRKKPHPSTTPSMAQKHDVSPGSNGAILTLSDGKQLVLDSLQHGVIAQQPGTQITLTDGQLAYAPATTVTEHAAFNTMSTPKGRQFHLQLPDGTHAWLNAASSITYPTTFSGKERKVTITGEVYFEVTKDPRKPFKVKADKGAEIEVLGTHFNANTYTDEPRQHITLIEGAVRVTADHQTQILKPGQQAQVQPNGSVTLEKNANIEKVMAWRRGVFNFDNASLAEVMRQLARWYNVEVVYEGPVPVAQCQGWIQRDLNLSDVLEGLNRTGVQFRIDGKQLIVLAAQ